jgi:WD40 repeat protein
MGSLTRRAFGVAGIGAALASAGAVRPAGASWLGNLLPGGRSMTDSGGVRLKQIASVDLRSQGDEFSWSVSTMAWSPDGSRIVAVNGLGNFLNVIDTATWRLLVRFRIMSGAHMRQFGFAANGNQVIASKWVAPGSKENPPAFSFFETDTGKVIRESERLPIFIPEFYGKTDDFALQQRRSDQLLSVSPDGRYVFINLSARISGTTRWFNYVYSAGDGHLITTGDARRFALPSISRNNLLAGIVTYSAQSLWAARRELTIYDLPSLNNRLSFAVSPSGIASLAWSPDGASLLTGASADGQAEEAIRIWNAANGERLGGFVGRFEPVSYADWHPSGRIFASSSAKGTGETGSLLQILPSEGGPALYQHSAPSSVVITGLSFCPMTGRLAWHERGRILIHEIQGL